MLKPAIVVNSSSCLMSDIHLLPVHFVLPGKLCYQGFVEKVSHNVIIAS